MSDEINKHVQKSVREDFEDLEIGQAVIISVKGGWELKVTMTERGLEFKHYNPWQGDRSKEAFYTYLNSNENGSGMMKQESTLGIPCRNCGIENDGRIIGALVTDDRCEIVDRFSLSKIVYVQEHDLGISPEGEVHIDGESKGFIGTIYLPDKNRLDGYVAVTFPQKPAEVRDIEMEDLLMCQVPGISALKTE